MTGRAFPAVLVCAAFVFVTGVGVGSLVTEEIFYSGWRRDPQKILELRKSCLKDDPGKYTYYCDDYADKYSWVKP